MMIKEVESKLKDFFEAEEFTPKGIVKRRLAALINLQGVEYQKEVLLDKKGVFRQRKRICINPECRSTEVQWNGYHKCDSYMAAEIGVNMKIGQCICKSCGLRWSIDADAIYTLFEQCKEQARILATEMRANKTSLMKTGELLLPVVGKKYSHTSVRRWYNNKTSCLQEQKIPQEGYSGYYAYDEPEVSAGGIKLQRLTLRDLRIKQPVSETLAPDKSKESIRGFLIQSLKDKPKIAMIVDGATIYPDIIENDLKMNYQIDIRHLFDNIREAFKDECAYGIGHKKLHLVDEIKKQEIMDVLYPRPGLISFVKKGLKRLKGIKDESLKEQVDVGLQKELLKLKIARKKARRRKNYVHEHIGYTEKEARKKFDFVKSICQYYPKTVQKLIDKIDKNWDHYALFLLDRNVPPTSNYIEQYFSSTLQWQDKKEFRNEVQLNEFIRLERLKKTGNFVELLTKTGMNFIQIMGIFLYTFLTV